MENERRAAMYLELEKTVRELKELEWQLGQFRSLITELEFYLKGEDLDKALKRLEKPEVEEVLNYEALIELLRRILRLRAKKRDLERKLSIRITLE